KGLLGLRKSKIVHRDLKPSNVFITSKATEFARGRLTLGYTFASITSEHHHRAEVPFTVKIGDFGLARFLEDSEELTAGIGTEGYIAPEVRNGGPYGTESDLYSLGIMLKKDLEAADFFSWLESNDTHSRTHSDSMRVILGLTNPDPSERPTIETLISTLTNFTLVEHTNEHTDEVTLSLTWNRDS
ncbi:transmembrane protein, partial [Aphelenchoides avenae]